MKQKSGKKFWSVMFLCGALLAANKAVAGEITAIDFNGGIIGKVISTGMVINEKGQNIGYITADSLIMDNQNNVIGGVVPQGIALGLDNRLLGKVGGDGIVRSLSGKEQGHVLPNGLVVDVNFEICGAVLYPGLVYSAQGNTIGRLTGAGTYTNLDGQEIGFVSTNGYAYRKSGDSYVLDGRLVSAKMVVANDGRFLGSIAPSGKVVDFEGKEIGSIHANGYAYDKNNQVIGGIVGSNYAFDMAGRYMGIVSYNGTIQDGDKVIGFYRPDGSIVNAKQEVIGYAVSMMSAFTDNSGKYLGRLVPGGNVVQGIKVVGKLGAKGSVYDKDGKRIGSAFKTGPVFDVLANLKAQAMPNGSVVSLNGSRIGSMRDKYAFDTNGTMMGAVSTNMLAISRQNQSLGVADLDSAVRSGADRQKISPFGFVLSADNKVTGRSFDNSPIYGLEGLLYSYLTPNGTLYKSSSDMVLSEGGILMNKNGYIGEFVSPVFVQSFNGKNMGRLTQNNFVLNDKGNIAYKVLPGGYVAEATDQNAKNLMPVKGFSSTRRVAISIGGDLIGYAEADGSVRDLSGGIYGRVLYGDYVADNNGIVSGQLVPFVPVINDKCSVIGVVNGRGDIINNRDVLVGHILPNGQAISDVGSYIGYAAFNVGLVDFDGKFVGTLNGGTAVDAQGKTLGCVNRHGVVTDAENKWKYGNYASEPVIDFDGQMIGFVLANGNVADADGQLIGYVQPNRDVVSKSKRTLGNVMSYKVAYGNDNNFLGMVQSDGQVVNAKNEVVGQVDFDGSVKYQNQDIGYALYDFYVYDENFVTYGYLTKDGTVLSMVGSRLGRMDRGFVVDKNNRIVARGNRDYIVRNRNNDAVGVLQMDGNVLDFENQNVGYLSEAGVIRNSAEQEVAVAMPLQYYVVSENTGRQQDWVDRKRVQIQDAETGKPDSDTTQVTTDRKPSGGTKKPVSSSAGQKIVGIALSPDGDVIGNIYDDDSVRNDAGDQIGFRTPDGIIVDMNYNPIGVEEVQRGLGNNMFIPANAFGTGNPYGIGNRPSNLGAGGGYGPGERYDEALQRVVAQAQSNYSRSIAPGYVKSGYRTSSFTGYEEDGWPGVNRNISTWRVDMSQMILEDKPIPAVLARSVYSDGAAGDIPVTAVVERNVYAEEGRNIIIPAGSRVIGTAGGGGEGGFSGNSGGAIKMGITWKRLIRPDGSQFMLSGAQTADAQGRAGAIGYLDEQLMKRYTFPLVETALQSAVTYLMASGDGTTTYENGTSTSDSRSEAAQDARKNFEQRMNQIFDEIIERKSRIKSVAYIPVGTRIIIFPNEDLWLRSVEIDKKEKANGTGDEEGSRFSNETGLVSTHTEEGPYGGVKVQGHQESVRPVSGGTGQQRPNIVYTNNNGRGNTPPTSAGQDLTTNKSTDDDIPDLL